MKDVKWTDAYGVNAEYPIILKDCDKKEPYLHYGKRKIKVADLTMLEGFEPTKTYKLHCVNPDCNTKPWCVGVDTSFGWQQVSPWYFYKGHALNWCKRNNIVLS